MTRRTYVHRGGRMVEVDKSTLRPMGADAPNVIASEERGFSFQMPLNYEYADQHTTGKGGLPAGMPCWTTASQGEDIAKRATDNGEKLAWDRRTMRVKGKKIYKGKR